MGGFNVWGAIIAFIGFLLVYMGIKNNYKGVKNAFAVPPNPQKPGDPGYYIPKL